jgi:quercetin dioxygenase-like cupin family protein
MTLEELSKKSGVALATLSRIENNKMSGTMHSHLNICKALKVSISELYKELENAEKTIEPVSTETRAEHFVYSQKSSFELLVTKVREKKILPLLLKLGPGGETPEENNSRGIEKFMYVISGSLQALIDNTTYELNSGDSLYFDASLPHKFKNTCSKKSEAICVISPPEFSYPENSG